MKIRNYTIINTIQENGENANVYLVEDENSEKYIIKEFSKKVMPYIGYAKYNHFGRRREAAEKVYVEIKNAANEFQFLTKFYDRFKWKNKWCIVIEYFNGVTLNEFFKKNYTDFNKMKNVITNFAIEVSNWHKNGFAHGDPHLDNVLVNINDLSIKLIDYSQIHNKDFYCCERFNCFEKNHSKKRFIEDLENNGKIGRGFLFDLKNVEKKLNIYNKISSIFENQYNLEMMK